MRFCQVFIFILISFVCATVAITESSSCEIQVINSRTNVTLLTVPQQFSTIDSGSVSICSEKKYLITTKPTDACQTIRSISEYWSNDNIYNARAASASDSSAQNRCWICLISSGGCVLRTKLKYAQDGGCNHVFISLQDSDDFSIISQDVRNLKLQFGVKVSFINSEDGEPLQKFAYPKRYKWKISDCAKSSIPVPEAQSESSNTLSWTVKIIGVLVILWFINRVNPGYANNILHGLRLSFWPIFVICTCLLLILGKTEVVLHGTDRQSVFLAQNG